MKAEYAVDHTELSVTFEEWDKLTATWRELGGTVEGVDEGVQLFCDPDGIVVFTARIERRN